MRGDRLRSAQSLIKEIALSRDKRSLPWWIILPVVIVAGMVLLVSFFGPVSNLIVQNTPAPYSASDEPLIEAAVRESFGNEPISSVRRHSYPVVVHLPDMSCVGFNVRSGVLGTSRTVCFRKADGSVAVRHAY